MSSRSPELEQVRQMLFPQLPSDEGWELIDTALARAADEDRLNRIDALARRMLGEVHRRHPDD